MPDNKEKLLSELFKVQKEESKIKKKRIELEDQIKNLYSFTGKSKSFNEDFEKNSYKVTVKKAETVSLNQDEYKKIRETIPIDRRPEKIEFKLVEKGYDWLEENDHENFLKVSNCVDRKYGKMSIKVEKI